MMLKWSWRDHLVRVLVVAAFATLAGAVTRPASGQSAAVMGGRVAIDGSAIPGLARAMRRDLERAARSAYGPTAPVAMLAGQVMAESGWRPDVCSPYACGLTQFTPGTRDDVERWWGVELGEPVNAPDRRMDPRWALRAQSLYMKRLEDQLGGDDECSRRLFALSAYNGGAGWVQRDRSAAAASGEPAGDYWSVTRHNAGRSGSAFAENRHYPKVIVYRWQVVFAAAGWGGAVCDVIGS